MVVDHSILPAGYNNGRLNTWMLSVVDAVITDSEEPEVGLSVLNSKYNDFTRIPFPS